MPKYRKTALVEADQFLPRGGKIPDGVISSENSDPRASDAQWCLETLEGKHILRDGDYICTGPKGEKWNVEKSIFEATYEAVTEDERIPAPPAELEKQYSAAPSMVIAEGFDMSDATDYPAGYIEYREPVEQIVPGERYARFQEIITGAINGCSMENGSDTPDFLLGQLLTEFLQSFDRLMRARDQWYGGSHRQLKAQLEAEGEHTAAGQAEIDRLNMKLEPK